MRFAPVCIALLYSGLVSAQTLEECAFLADSNPEAALEMSTTGALAETDSSWLCQAKALEKLQRFSQAAKVVSDLAAVEQHPENKLALTISAAQNFAAAKDPKAVLWAKAWTQLESDSVDAWLILAETEADYSSALAAALSAQTVAPLDSRPRALAVTAQIRMKKGDLDGAQKDLFSALALNKNDPTARFVLGRWLLINDQVLEAEEIWRSLLGNETWKARAEQELLRFEN